jgi:excisionase family DNA binding protein
VEKLLTVEELGELIQVSPKTIYQWTHTGFIPHYKFRKGLRFRQADIEEWLRRKKRRGRSTLKLQM